MAAVESSPGHLGAKSTNQTPTAAVEGKLRSSTNQPNPTGSPAQPANQILRCGCCNNPRMKFESLVSVDSSKDGTVQNFPPAKHILTQLDVATGSGSGRLAEFIHCSHRSMPNIWVKLLTSRLLNFHIMYENETHESDETSKHPWVW